MRTPFNTLAFIAALSLFSCNSNSADPSDTASKPETSSAGKKKPGKDTFLVDPDKPNLPPARHNPELRNEVKKEPVAEYHEKTGHILGDFSVKLYQTAKTMNYRVEVEFEGLPGTDTIHLPDLGTEPQPVLQKGNTKYSCIIGFLDNDKKFRESKLVYVTPKGNQFKITTLHHWHVTNHYRLVPE